MQQPLLQINLGKLAFLMKIYRRLYPQTVNQLFPGTIHPFLQCEPVYSTSPKLIYLLGVHGYLPCPHLLDHQQAGRDAVENGFLLWKLPRSDETQIIAHNLRGDAPQQEGVNVLEHLS